MPENQQNHSGKLLGRPVFQIFSCFSDHIAEILGPASMAIKSEVGMCPDAFLQGWEYGCL